MSDFSITPEDTRFVRVTLLKAREVARAVFGKEEPASVFTIYELLINHMANRTHNEHVHGECPACGEVIAAGGEDDDEDDDEDSAEDDD